MSGTVSGDTGDEGRSPFINAAKDITPVGDSLILALEAELSKNLGTPQCSMSAA